MPPAKKTKATPKQHRREPAPGAVFTSDVLAANVRAYRRLRNTTQDELAAQMSQLGHGWSASKVGFIERGDRTIAAGDELLALAIVLETDVLALLDPTGIDGRQTKPVDYAVQPLPHGIEATLPAVVVKHWLRGAVQVQFPRGPGGFELYAVEGHEAEYAECERAWQKLREERTERKAERIANRERGT